ncbi:hypothetical protein FKM82_010215 [Ascaphus truei]
MESDKVLLNVFNDSDFFSGTLRSQTIQINTVTFSQRRHCLLLIGQMVHRQCSPARSHFLARAYSEFSRQFPFNGGSPLKLIINVHT